MQAEEKRQRKAEMGNTLSIQYFPTQWPMLEGGEKVFFKLGKQILNDFGVARGFTSILELMPGKRERKGKEEVKDRHSRNTCRRIQWEQKGERGFKQSLYLPQGNNQGMRESTDCTTARAQRIMIVGVVTRRARREGGVGAKCGQGFKKKKLKYYCSYLPQGTNQRDEEKRTETVKQDTRRMMKGLTTTDYKRIVVCQIRLKIS